MRITHSVHLDFDFKKNNYNTVCIPRGEEEFEELEEAKSECKKKRYCKGVLHPGCMDQTKYYLCNVTAKLVTNTIEPSCFYQKNVIGKKGLRVSFQIYVIFLDYFCDHIQLRDLLNIPHLYRKRTCFTFNNSVYTKNDINEYICYRDYR